MIVDHRTYELQPGRLRDFLALYEKEGLPVQLKHLGNLVGYYTTEVGNVNEIVHIWGYADLADRTKRRAAMAADPANQLLWRMPLKRLEAELVRDALMSVGGQLDSRLGGPPLPVETRADGSVVIDEKTLPSPAAKARRSLYVLARRNYHLSMLNVFDQPAMSTNCPQRQQSAVVLQSLAMLNDDFVREQALHFARRVRGVGAADAATQIELAFRIALGRMPSGQEIAWSQDLLARQAAELAATSISAEAIAEQSLTHLCHMLLNTNEFLYIP